MDNLYECIPAELPEELTTVLAKTGAVRIERIVSAGHASPAGFWYDQPEDEWVLLLTGSAELELERTGEMIALKPGDHLMIPAHCRHRVASTASDEKTIWLAVFCPPASAQSSSMI